MPKDSLSKRKLLLVSIICGICISCIPLLGLIFSFEIYGLLFLIFHFPSFVVMDKLGWYINNESIMQAGILIGLVFETILYSVFIYLVLTVKVPPKTTLNQE